MGSFALGLFALTAYPAAALGMTDAGWIVWVLVMLLVTCFQVLMAMPRG